MSKKLIIIIAIAITLLTGLIVYALFFNTPSNPSTLGNNSRSIVIKDKNNVSIKLNDFVSSAVMNYGDVPVLESNERFSIQYDTKNNIFQIYLGITNADQLESYRIESENVLAEKLGIKITDLCSLSVVENIPNNGTVDLPVYSYIPSVCDK